MVKQFYFKQFNLVLVIFFALSLNLKQLPSSFDHYWIEIIIDAIIVD